MKIWLDDIRNPTEEYYQIHYGACGDEVWVKTVEEAILLLEAGGVESISLDNDLGDGQREGYEVACWIEEQAFQTRYNSSPGLLKPLQIFAHSDNSVANPKMRQAIANAYRFWGIE